jgi:hypothetical protein
LYIIGISILPLHASNNAANEPVETLDEILSIIVTIKNEFGSNSFPLANNVAKLGKGTEVRGLGTIILDQTPGDVTHAQGSSYLGPILEHLGYFVWNGKYTGIKWSLKDFNIDIRDITNRLTEGSYCK